MMLDGQERPGRQKVLQMAFPPRWIFTLPKSARSRPIKNVFDASSQPARGLVLRVPDRLQCFQHKVSPGRLDREFAENRLSIGRQGRAPLCLMLLVAPFALMRRDVSLGG